ncbi:hypothetical protein GIS00_02515 [Nakamurella sp. YIM 132087]|uniref:Uncharacterized protein n=1 Tax=Nakamurella alba TaxID=2665158 RepID=A0A7K1FFE1_9ACTN|nr:hypothetical protein [Nakamurella alba]MTD12818.1 hypothetical protein [Nakamurella alba]
MSDDLETRLRTALDEHGDTFSSDLRWDDILRRSSKRSPRRWMIPLMAAAAVIVVVAVTIGVTRSGGDSDVASSGSNRWTVASDAPGLPGTGVFPGNPWDEGVNDSSVLAAWALHSDQLVVITFGSSSCPELVRGISQTAPGELTLDTETVPDGNACTADLSPHTTLIDPPPNIGPAVPLTIVVGDQRIDVPARADGSGSIISEGLGFPEPGSVPTGMPMSFTDPSAAKDVSIEWSTKDGALVVVTFGSGTCPELVLQITQTGDNEVTLIIGNRYQVAPTPTSYSCTADRVPYTTIIQPPAGIDAERPLAVVWDNERITLPAKTSSPATGSVISQGLNNSDPSLPEQTNFVGAGPDAIAVAWSPTADVLILTTRGSSSTTAGCLQTVARVELTDADTITMILDREVFASTASAPPTCRADLASTTAVIDPPLGVTPDRAYTVIVGGNRAQLLPRAGGTPTAVPTTPTRPPGTVPTRPTGAVVGGDGLSPVGPVVTTDIWGEPIKKVASVSWAAEGDFLLVESLGSGSCPNPVTKVEDLGDSRVFILVEAYHGPEMCTADLSPTPYLLALPPGFTSDQTLNLLVGNQEVFLPAREPGSSATPRATGSVLPEETDPESSATTVSTDVEGSPIRLVDSISWAAEGDLLVLRTSATGNCFKSVTSVEDLGDARVSILVQASSYFGTCNDNFVSRPILIALPPGFTADRPLELLVNNQHVLLPARP